MKLKCLIVDDEHLARKLLEDYLGKMTGVELVGVCKNAMEAMQVIRDKEVDLMFLDIQMPDLTGLDLLRTMKVRPAVIFTTAYSEYALQGYELDVVDYLLKPISFERFVQAVNKASELISLRQKAETKSNETDHLIVKADHKLVRIKLEDILYIEGLREYVSIYTKEKRVITLEAMKNLEDILPANKFLRTHRSYIVSINHAEAMNGNNVEINGKLIPVGKTYRDEVLRRFSENWH